MQRKATRQSRGPNAEEKAFQGWLKEHDCIWCGNPGPSIVDHCMGATFKHKKVHAGHWFCVSSCVQCDTGKTIHGKRPGNESQAWLKLESEYNDTKTLGAPFDVFESIKYWDK